MSAKLIFSNTMLSHAIWGRWSEITFFGVGSGAHQRLHEMQLSEDPAMYIARPSSWNIDTCTNARLQRSVCQDPRMAQCSLESEILRTGLWLNAFHPSLYANNTPVWYVHLKIHTFSPDNDVSESCIWHSNLLFSLLSVQIPSRKSELTSAS